MFLKPLLVSALLFSTIINSSYAQTGAKLPQEMIDSTEFKSLLFQKFQEGVVLMKSGQMERAQMNYSALHQSIIFLNGGQYLTLTGLEDVDTIYLQHKTFIPVKNKVFEVIRNLGSGTALLASYSVNKRPFAATTDKNATEKREVNRVSNTVSDVYVSRNFHANQMVELESHYWIKQRQALYRADTKNQLRKVFSKTSKQELDCILETNNLNLLVGDDVVALIDYLSER